ncbi:hypothetical protein RSP_0028 [Pseudomonas phage RSP]|nr:hypothetical protein RSP_0028 [Pseudomonas phage RSP]
MPVDGSNYTGCKSKVKGSRVNSSVNRTVKSRVLFKTKHVKRKRYADARFTRHSVKRRVVKRRPIYPRKA